MQWIGTVVALLVGLAGGYYIRRSLGEAKIGSAEAEAKRLIDEAVKAVDTKDARSCWRPRAKPRKYETNSKRK